MNILVIGSGGREHALSWKIAQSEMCDKLFIAPGNAGTSNVGANVSINISDFDEVANFIKEENIQLVIVGPEDPLVNGIRDFLLNDPRSSKVLIVGPDKRGAMLEGSKDFSKQFMNKYNIPTARFSTFTRDTLEDGYAFLEDMSAPYVLKADGLAAGKGVLILNTIDEAVNSLKEMLLDNKFGAASEKVLIEEFMKGIEVSVFVLSDGKDYVILPEAKDYKRIGEGDTGLNTGGMGAVSPVPFADDTFMSKVEERIIKPTVSGLNAEGIDYRGFIFIGLMNVGGDPYVVEYNVRMGDPETQAVIPRVDNDLVELLKAAAEGKLGDTDIRFRPETATTVVMVAGGYPGKYEKDHAISGLSNQSEEIVFHAGTRVENGNVLSNGGRVLGITALHDHLEGALKKCYERIDGISWKDCYFRRDIGEDLKQ